MDRELIESCLSPPLPVGALPLTYMVCKGVTGAPKRQRSTWEEHARLVAAQGRQVVAAKTDTLTACYFTSSGGCGLDEVEALTAMFFDIDSGEDATPLLAALNEMQIAYLWSESCSSSAELRMWHLVLPIVSQVVGDAPPPLVTMPHDPILHAQRVAHWSKQYAAVADWMCDLGGLPRTWDKSCSNANRVRFVGARLSEDAPARKAICKGGRRIIWDALAAALGVAPWAPVLAEDGTPAASTRPGSGARVNVAPGSPDGGPTVGESTGSLLLKAASAWGTLGPAIGQPPSKYMVLCPWRDEHTTGQQAQGVHDSSTVIMVAGGGGFKCAHSHCVDRTAREYLSLAVKNSAVRQAVPDRKSWGGLTRAEQAAEMEAMQEQAKRKAAAAPKNAEPPAAVTVEGSENAVSAVESTDNCKVAPAAAEVKMSAAPANTAAPKASTAPRLAVLRAADAAESAPIDRSPKWTHLPAFVAAQLQKKPKSGGAIKETTGNVIAILSNDDRWAGVLRWNTFTVTMEKRIAPPWHRDLQGDLSGAGEWSKSDDRRLVAWLEREYQISIGSDTAGGCAAIVAQAHAYHPVRDYLSALTWDGVPRLATWLHTYLGAADTRYPSLAGRLWMISAVARVMSPGCQVDHMIVLEGAQGRGKSQSLRALSPWFSDTELAWQSKDKYQQIQGIWVYEVAELAGLSKHDNDQAKSFLSSPTDRFRAPYDSTVRAWPRSVAFAGSVNPDKARGNTYLKDPTGARRYWPIACFVTRERADVAGLRAAADQLWAEAVAAYRAGEQWHPSHEDEALFTAEQQSRNVEMQEDAWDGTIGEWLSATMGGAKAINQQGHVEVLPLTPAIILSHAVGVPRERQDQRGLNRVGSALRRLGWRRSERQRVIARTPCYPWEPDLTGADAEIYAQLVAAGDDATLQQLLRGPLTSERLRKALKAAQERRQPTQEALPGVE